MGFPVPALRGAPLVHTRTFRISARGAAFGAILLGYAVLTLGVLVNHSPILALDTSMLHVHVQGHHPQYKPFIRNYVIFGQRGPATLLFLPFFFWMAWRRRSTAPLVMLVTSLILLNVSVGIVKYATGRIGPAHINDVHMVFAGGNIYPSGHVSNTVVLYGLIAWIAPRFRKTIIAVAVFLCLSVGFGTIYLRTHWLSDVIGGWLAGALVLVALPTFMPTAQRWADRAVDSVRARRRRRAARRAPVERAVPVMASTPALVPRPVADQRTSTPVSSTARFHRLRARTSSRDALEDRTRCG